MAINTDFTAKFPREMILHLFSFLEIKSLGRSAQVCKTWNQFACDNEVWVKFCPPKNLGQKLAIKKTVKRLFDPVENEILEKIDQFTKKIMYGQEGTIEFKFLEHPKCIIKAKLRVFDSDSEVKPTYLNESVIIDGVVPNFGETSHFGASHWQWTMSSTVKVHNEIDGDSKLNHKIMQILKKREAELKAYPKMYYFVRIVLIFIAPFLLIYFLQEKFSGDNTI